MTPVSRRLSAVSLSAAGALAVGGGGGLLFTLLGLPLAWMLGALTATAAVRLAGAPIDLPPLVRRPVLAIIGVYLGAGFTPAVTEQLSGVAASLALMMLYIVFATAAAQFALRLFLPVTKRTALCAAVPGGISVALALTDSTTNERTVMFLQTMRILMTVVSASLATQWFSPAGIAANATTVTDGNDAPMLAVIAVGVILAGHWRGWRASSYLLAALLLSGAAHHAGWMSGNLPGGLLNLSLLAMGAIIGCSLGLFKGKNFSPSLLYIGAAVNGGMLAAAALFAWGGALLLDIPYWALLLALAPGGISEITLIALTLDIQPAFVAVHQIARIVAIVLFAPFIVDFFTKPKKR